MKFELLSFGRKYGLPEADVIFDVRCLDNPYWVPELRSLSGLERPVQDYIFKNAESRAFVQTMQQLLLQQAALTEKKDGALLRVGIGCTGGRHRSVAVTERLRQLLVQAGYEVAVTHRDIMRG